MKHFISSREYWIIYTTYIELASIIIYKCTFERLKWWFVYYITYNWPFANLNELPILISQMSKYRVTPQLASPLTCLVSSGLAL